MKFATAFVPALTRNIGAVVLGGLLALGTVSAATAADPTGTWQSTTGESRYEVSMCGDGTQLCAQLTWLRSDARTAENLAYLNRNVVTGATAAADNKWRGQLAYEGNTYAGSVTLTSADSLKLSGCKGLFCKTMTFQRI